MNSKFLIGVIVILLLIIAGLVFYFTILPQWQIAKKTVEFLSIQLESFPAGAEIKPGVAGTKTDTFKVGEYMGISGEVVLPGETELTFEIIDDNGNLIQGGAPAMTLEGSGGFRMCCINVPREVGSYYIKLFLAGEEKRVLPFEVIERH